MSEPPFSRQAIRVPLTRQIDAVERLARNADGGLRKSGAREAEITMTRADAAAAVETLRAIEPYQDEVRALIAERRRLG